MIGDKRRHLDAEANVVALNERARSAGLPWPFLRREWRAVARGCQIRVSTCGFLRASLDLDGSCVDRRSPLLTSTDPHVPLLTGRLPSRNDVTLVEVYVKNWLASRIRIVVGGRPVEAVRSDSLAASDRTGAVDQFGSST